MRLLRRFVRGSKASPEERTQPVAPAVVLPLDLLSAEFIADPHPAYDWLRRHAPVAPVTAGGILLTRHADVQAALGDKTLGNAPSRFSPLAARNRATYVAADLAAHIPPFLDLPAHRLPRQAISRGFHRALSGRDPGLAALACGLTRAQAGQGRVDLLETISRPYALTAMRGLLGLEGSPEMLKSVAESFFLLFAPLTDRAKFTALNDQMAGFRDHVTRSLEAKRGKAPRDFLGHMAALQADLPGLTDQHIVDAAILLLADGVENVETGAATLLHILAREGGSVDEAWVREALRLDTPGQIIPRVARQDTEIAGVPVKAGHPVFLALGAANRDGEVFDAPDVFDPTRDQGQALVFGRGAHRCIGEPLGIALLLALARALEAAGARPVSTGPMAYQPRFGHRWPARLEITIAAG
ncbi:cytochrome P450 [Pseudooceanicola nanhaiensis]|uniref:cytochrome P450 n=1 Tax=Pseudooceanicola nanhaiensis TaxID=375761 RepID=UPI001CD31ECA|nr:cytochrome P450 [Pseudooceanicola nanhaiensis]MCA0920351.1 cytochrome P450 [Pseudooceanicola nanhaiensis]